MGTTEINTAGNNNDNYQDISESTDSPSPNSSSALINNSETAPSCCVEVLLNVLCTPFSKQSRNYHMTWESILMFRRLLFILIFIYVPYPTIRSLLILILCIVMIIHSCCQAPFASNFVNKCEIILLLILAVLSTINVLNAFSDESNAYFEKILPDMFAWINVILVDILAILVMAGLMIPFCIWFVFTFMTLGYNTVRYISSVFERRRIVKEAETSEYERLLEQCE